MNLFAITLLQWFKIRFSGSKNWVNILSYSQAAPFFAYTTHHQVPEMLHDGQWTPDVSGNLMPHLFVPDIQIDTFAPSDFKDFPGTTHPFIIHHIHPIASILVNPYIFFCTGSVPKKPARIWCTHGSPRFDYEVEKPEKLHEEAKILCLPRRLPFFFPLICLVFWGQWQKLLARNSCNVSFLFGWEGRGWFDKPCLDRTVNPCGLKGEAPLNVVKWRTPCHGFANPLWLIHRYP